jgi:hypothetical protein
MALELGRKHRRANSSTAAAACEQGGTKEEEEKPVIDAFCQTSHVCQSTPSKPTDANGSRVCPLVKKESAHLMMPLVSGRHLESKVYRHKIGTIFCG